MFIGGFAGKLTGKARVDNCYTISYISSTYLNRTEYNKTNAGVFAGEINDATINNAYGLSRPNGLGLLGVAKNENSQVNVILDIPTYIQADQADGSVSTSTFHHDTGHPTLVYPYKNWTDANDNSTPGSTPLVVFYGDW